MTMQKSVVKKGKILGKVHLSILESSKERRMKLSGINQEPK